MQPVSKNAVLTRYQDLKKAVAAEAGNSANIEVENGRYTINDDVLISGVTVKAGGAFDEDDTTVDMLVTQSTTPQGARQSESFKTFQEEGGCIIKSQQNMMEYKISESSQTGFSNQSITFQV